MKQQPLTYNPAGLMLEPKKPKLPRSSEARFLAFHKAHPEVYGKLRRMALLRTSWAKKPGIRMFWEHLRWDLFMDNDGRNFKLNNNYPPHYARLLMKQEPELKGFFETRGGPE